MKRSVYLVAFLALLLRFGLGAAGNYLLPRIGYETKPQQAGYLFLDAYNRDSQSWDLAQSQKPLVRAFSGNYSSDQYGGLLWISAFIYRYLCAGTHQPLAIIFLAALVNSLGVFFVFKTGQKLADDKTALLAAGIYAFFPEAILLGASQMREPFLMTFIAMSFYGLVSWQTVHAKTPWLWIALGLAGTFLISPGLIIIMVFGAAGWIYFSEPAAAEGNRGKFPWIWFLGLLGFLIIAVLVVAASWNSIVAVKGNGPLGTIGNWARETARYNTYLLTRSSGIVQLLLKSLPSFLALPFVMFYGVLQPVLPAVLLEPGIPFWQILGTFRALGWYLVLPLLAFAPMGIWVLPPQQRRKQWLWLIFLVWVWILIAALRGGGDQWDNPRYRVMLLPWIALLSALAFKQISSAAKRWFWRICAVEGILLLIFGHWYVWRYLNIGFNIGIRNTLILAIGLSVLVVFGDWFWQIYKRPNRL